MNPPPSHPAFVSLIERVHSLAGCEPRIAIRHLDVMLAALADELMGDRYTLMEQLVLSAWLEDHRALHQRRLEEERKCLS